MRDKGWYTVVFTFFLTFSAVLALAVVYDGTREIEVRNHVVRRQAAVLRALGERNVDIRDYRDVSTRYHGLENPVDGMYLRETATGPVVGRVFSGPGVWGDIHGVIGVATEDLRVTGIEILRHSETPGLGGRVATDQFLDQLRGERIGDSGIRITVRGPGNYDPDDATIDGITGATGTTRAFRAILEREVGSFKEMLTAAGNANRG